jgi:hypothetical protein
MNVPTMTRHHVITMNHQGGYTARCEYEVDGEVQLCNIAFGGFATKTAARQACKRGCPEAVNR